MALRVYTADQRGYRGEERYPEIAYKEDWLYFKKSNIRDVLKEINNLPLPFQKGLSLRVRTIPRKDSNAGVNDNESRISQYPRHRNYGNFVYNRPLVQPRSTKKKGVQKDLP